MENGKWASLSICHLPFSIIQPLTFPTSLWHESPMFQVRPSPYLPAMRHHGHCVNLSLLMLLTLLAAGCSSPSKGEKQVRSFTKTRDFLIEAQNQVDRTLL